MTTFANRIGDRWGPTPPATHSEIQDGSSQELSRLPPPEPLNTVLAFRCGLCQGLLYMQRSWMVGMLMAVSVGLHGPAARGQPTWPPVPAPTLPLVPSLSPAPAPGSTAVVVPASASRIQFAENPINFGRVPAGQVVRCEFVFTNVGITPLEIRDVRPGCGCTAAGAWDRRVEPGQTGKIPLQLNTAGFNGVLHKTATLSCNDATQPTVILQMKGEAWKPIDINPSYIIINPVRDPKTNDSRIVRIVNNMDTPLELSELHCSSGSFRTTLKEIRPGKEFHLEVVTVPPLPYGTTRGSIQMKSSSTNMPVLQVAAMAVVPQPVSATPSQIVLPSGPINTPVQSAVAFRNNESLPVSLASPTVNVPGVEASLIEVQTGRVFKVTLHFPTGFQLATGQRTELAVKTTHPQLPIITVPIIQTVGIPATRPGTLGPAPKSMPPQPTVRVSRPAPPLPVAPRPPSPALPQ